MEPFWTKYFYRILCFLWRVPAEKRESLERRGLSLEKLVREREEHLCDKNPIPRAWKATGWIEKERRRGRIKKIQQRLTEFNIQEEWSRVSHHIGAIYAINVFFKAAAYLEAFRQIAEAENGYKLNFKETPEEGSVNFRPYLLKRESWGYSYAEALAVAIFFLQHSKWLPD